MSKGFVYLFQGIGTTYYKVGRTDNIPERIDTLSQQTPFNLKLIDYFFSKEVVEDEDCIKNKLKQYRIKGEWFNLPNEIANNRLWFKPQEWIKMKQCIQYEFNPKDIWVFTYKSGGLIDELDSCIEEFLSVVIGEKLPKESVIRKHCLKRGYFSHLGAEIELERLIHEKQYEANNNAQAK